MRIDLSRLGSVTRESDGEHWSAAKLCESSLRRANVLIERGVVPGDKILISHGGSGSFFADLFATWMTGACACVLSPALTLSEITTIGRFVKSKMRLVDVASGGSSDTCALAALENSAPAREPAVVGSLDDDALILFTSGTTGVPKGVVHSFRSLLSRIALNQTTIGVETLAASLCPLPTHFGHGLIGNCLTPLMGGGALTIVSAGDVRTITRLGEIIDLHRTRFMSSVPALWRVATKTAQPPVKGSLRRVHIGSSGLPSNLWRAVVEWAGTPNVVNVYGITETANWIGGASAAEFEPQDGLVGRVWGGSAAVQKEDGSLASEGEGEILVQTPSLMSRYLSLREESKRVLEGGWFRTGDIGRIEKGLLRLSGRKKFEINRAGLKIHPEDIDILLERHPGVVEACAFALPDAVAGEIVGVAVALAGGVTVSDLRSWCAKHLTKEKLPDKWFVVERVPKNDRGKVNREFVARNCLETARK